MRKNVQIPHTLNLINRNRFQTEIWLKSVCKSSVSDLKNHHFYGETTAWASKKIEISITKSKQTIEISSFRHAELNLFVVLTCTVTITIITIESEFQEFMETLRHVYGHCVCVCCFFYVKRALHLEIEIDEEKFLKEIEFPLKFYLRTTFFDARMNFHLTYRYDNVLK